MAKASTSAQFSWNPDPVSGVRQRFVAANGLQFELAEAGEAQSRKFAIMLHGFPELNYSWRHQMPELAAQGWRVWAPNMRGYGESDKPEGVAAYRLDHLLNDVAVLIDLAISEFPADEIMLVAHDWGAVIAWLFAIRKIRALDRLVIMNVPHPKCAERELKYWRQKKKSWYILAFQLPWLPEKLLLANNAKAVRGAFFNSAANKDRFSRADLDIYARAAQRPGAIQSMVNYYRALVRFPEARQVGDAMVDVPTLVIWGENDIALDIHLLDGMEEWVPNLTLHRLPGISHWVQQDAPEEVNRLLGRWLDRPLA